jgi:hypothetical protein
VGQAEGVCVGCPDTEALALAQPDGDAAALCDDDAEGHPESLAEALCESDAEAHSEADAEALGDGEAEVQIVADAEAHGEAVPVPEAEPVALDVGHPLAVAAADAAADAVPVTDDSDDADAVREALNEEEPVAAADKVADSVPVSDVRAVADADRELLLEEVLVALAVEHREPLRDAVPDADVVILGHAGLESVRRLADVWRGTVVGARIRARVWCYRAREIPRDPEAREAWLHARWLELDAWVRAPGQPG